MVLIVNLVLESFNMGLLTDPIHLVETSYLSVALSEKPPVWKVIGQIKDENLGYSDKPDLITVKAIISPVSPGFISCYVACPLVVNGKRCNAKATRVDGMWRCKNCEYSFLRPSEYGLSVRMQIMDHTGLTSVTMSEEAAEEIFGCRGRDLHSLKHKEQDYAELRDIILGAVRKQYVFQLKVEGRAPEPAFSKVGSVECIVLKAEKVNPSAEFHRLMGQIDTRRRVQVQVHWNHVSVQACGDPPTP